MPTTANPSAGSFTLADLTATISYLVDGDQVNMDDLYKEVAPGGTPKLTMMRLANLVAMLGKGAPDLGQTTVVEQSLMIDFSHAPAYPILAGGNGVGTAGDTVVQMLAKLKHGVKLTSVSFYFQPDGHGSLPGTMPNFRVFRRNVLTGALTTIAALVTDPSANTTAYNTLHAITAPITAGSGTSYEVVDLTQNVYYGSFVSESGSNSDTNTVFYGCVMSVAYA